MASAILFGALTGAIGTLSAPTKIWEYVKKGVYSLVVGYGVGINTYNSGVNSWENALIAGAAAALGTFAGSLISTEGADKFGTFFANYAIGLTTGTPAEIISTAGQQMTSSNNVKAVGKNPTRTQNNTNQSCRISSGMTTADYFRQQYNT